MNHPPAAYMPPIGFDKKPHKYKTAPKKKKKKTKNKNLETEYLRPSKIPEYDDYFEPYTSQPSKVSTSSWPPRLGKGILLLKVT